MNIIKRTYIYVIFSFYGLFLFANDKSSQFYTIMPIGDSITEGVVGGYSYLYPLWERLYETGMTFKFVGPRCSETRIGRLQHCAFSGKTAEFIDALIDSVYKRFPADIILLHIGHNHCSSEHPVKNIMNAYRSIIRKIININPDVKVVISKIIPSDKLPKYSYIPELNDSIEALVSSIDNLNVIMSDPCPGFIVNEYTIADKVHPNKKGAYHIANAWLDAVQRITGTSSVLFQPQKLTYKLLENGDSLQLHLFGPKNSSNIRKPCILYFFGGGWSHGTPLQFYKECAYYASKGMVAISVDYRISSIHSSTPFQSLEDARDAIGWVMKNSDILGIDSDKIAVAGASAGGQLAAAIGTSVPYIKGSSRPDLMLLYYPVIDNGPDGYGTKEMKQKYEEISPLHNLTKETPPSLLLLGTKDHLIPVKTSEEFKRKLLRKGVDCEVHLFEGYGHPIFNYRDPLDSVFYEVRKYTDNFLAKHGYVN